MCGYTNKEIAKKTAEWWANQLGKTDADGGDKTISAIFREARQQSALDINERNKQHFCDVLELLVLMSKPATISVDYDPDENLSLALGKARIRAYGALPIRSATSINWDTGEISAKLGYDGEWICLQNPRN